jgi:hypothetical protein
VERRHWAKGLFLGDDHVGRHIGQNVGSKKLLPFAARLPPLTIFAPFFMAAAMCASPSS